MQSLGSAPCKPGLGDCHQCCRNYHIRSQPGPLTHFQSWSTNAVLQQQTAVLTSGRRIEDTKEGKCECGGGERS